MQDFALAVYPSGFIEWGPDVLKSVAWQALVLKMGEKESLRNPCLAFFWSLHFWCNHISNKWYIIISVKPALTFSRSQPSFISTTPSYFCTYFFRFVVRGGYLTLHSGRALALWSRGHGILTRKATVEYPLIAPSWRCISYSDVKSYWGLDFLPNLYILCLFCPKQHGKASIFCKGKSVVLHLLEGPD